jgi:hypothetical protein
MHGAALPELALQDGHKPVPETAFRRIGVGTTKFDEMVDDRRMPRAKRIDGRLVWDRIKLDEAFDALDDDLGSKNEWDEL